MPYIRPCRLCGELHDCNRDSEQEFQYTLCEQCCAKQKLRREIGEEVHQFRINVLRGWFKDAVHPETRVPQSRRIEDILYEEPEVGYVSLLLKNGTKIVYVETPKLYSDLKAMCAKHRQDSTRGNE